MFVTRIIIFFSFCVICLSCDKESCNPNDMLELRTDFNEEEFLKAILGQWEGVLEIETRANVTYLELCEQGNAKITLKEEGTVEHFEGNYTVEFTHIGNPTSADITIITSKENLILSRVHFGFNSLVSSTEPFLTIDGPIWGLLSRME